MCEGYSSRFVCVCVCVCLCVCVSVTALAATYLVCKSKVRCYKVPYGVLNLYMCYVDFAENALFSSFVVICLQQLPSTLSEKFLMGRTNSTGLFSEHKVCSFSNSSYKLTDSSP